MKKIISKVKLLDFYPKTLEEATERTTAGAIVSFIGLSCILFLVISELSEYYTTKKEDVLSVYTSRGEKLPINFRMTFFQLPCEAINIDVTNRFGEEMFSHDVSQDINLIKRPWKGQFDNAIEEVGKQGWRNYYDRELRLWSILGRETVPQTKDRECQSCYDASSRQKCCNSCFTLKTAYAQSGLDPSKADNLPQCLSPSEGCLVSGYARVDKVQGGFHIAVGQSHSEPGQRHHHHWDVPLRKLGFNSTHYIHHFSFGAEFPGIQNPLDGSVFVEKGVGQQSYYLSVIPTQYTKSNGYKILTNQYSVTQHYSPIDINAENIELPGVFFKYDISALMISIEEKPIALAHLFVRLFAIIGGVWAVIGMVYGSAKNVIDNVLKSLKNL